MISKFASPPTLGLSTRKRIFRRLLLVTTFYWIAFLGVSLASTTSGGEVPFDLVTARAAFLLDAKTGGIIYEKNSDLPLPPASTTKVVTALVALEHKSPTDVLRVSKNATSVPPCKIAVRAGEQWQLDDLLRCILLNSANDASVVIAEGTAGSVDKFAELMNAKAGDLGACHSHFANPHGLDQGDHYATVRDMAMIFRYAMTIPLFREICETKSMSIRGPRSRVLHLRNHNRLLGTYEGMIGGKTGYTRQAKKCFVGEATRNGKDLVVCVFGSKNHFKDAALLLDYGFDGSPRTINPETVSAQFTNSDLSQKAECENGNYVIQVASFFERGKALGLSRNLVAQGYLAFVEEAACRKGVICHRVKVGFYPDMESALRTKELIRKSYGFDSIILQQ